MKTQVTGFTESHWKTYFSLKMMLCLILIILILTAVISASFRSPRESDPEKTSPAEQVGIEERMMREGRLAILIPGMF